MPAPLWLKVQHVPNVAYMAESLRARYPLSWTDSRAFAEWGSTFDVTSWDANDVAQVRQYRVQIEPDESRTLYRRADIGALDDQGRIVFPNG